MKVIIHGGFFTESSTSNETKSAKQEALKAIAIKAHMYLNTHTAFETAVFAAELLENDPLFNAGTGSQIQSDGKIRMSASVMDGLTQKFSAVINIENIKNPIRLAEKLNAYDDKVLGGEVASEFAQQLGFEKYNTATQQRINEYEQKLSASRALGTIGCVAIDRDGNIAASTSTGGKGFEIPGRISDSATVAGNYANSFCGVSCTGVGEDIVSVALASKIVTRVTDGMGLSDAFARSFEELKTLDGFAGAIAIDYLGNIFHQDSHPSMVYASYDGKDLNVFQ